MNECCKRLGGGGDVWVKIAFPGIVGTIGGGGFTYGPEKGGGTYRNFGLQE